MVGEEVTGGPPTRPAHLGGDRQTVHVSVLGGEQVDLRGVHRRHGGAHHCDAFRAAAYSSASVCPDRCT